MKQGKQPQITRIKTSEERAVEQLRQRVEQRKTAEQRKLECQQRRTEKQIPHKDERKRHFKETGVNKNGIPRFGERLPKYKRRKDADE